MTIPKKLNKKHRGFCFVDFNSHNDAKNMLDIMKNIHFYGRHLSLEWAEKTEES